MTEAQKTDTRTEERARMANKLYEVLQEASEAGFRAVVADGWKLDLVDLETGEREPIWALMEVQGPIWALVEVEK